MARPLVQTVLVVLSAERTYGHAGPQAHTHPLMDYIPGPEVPIVLFALGLALGRTGANTRELPIGGLAIALGAGLVAGFLAAAWLPVALGAIVLVAGGVLLIDPWGRLDGIATPFIVATVLCAGVAWGRGVAELSAWPLYVGGATFGGMVVTLAGLYLWLYVYRPWFPYAARIAGSWMAAAGLLLLAMAFR